jgi:hypothetical protein
MYEILQSFFFLEILKLNNTPLYFNKPPFTINSSIYL